MDAGPTLPLEPSNSSEFVKTVRDKIFNLIVAQNELVQQIKNMDQVISALEDAEQQKTYAFQLLDVIKEYNETYYNLMLALEEYQTLEKDKHLPIDMNYRRLYRTLTQCAQGLKNR